MNLLYRKTSMNQTNPCPKCTTPLKAIAKFCPSCGINLYPIFGKINFRLIKIASVILLLQTLVISLPSIFLTEVILQIIPFNFLIIISWFFYIDIIGFIFVIPHTRAIVKKYIKNKLRTMARDRNSINIRYFSHF